MSGELTLDVYVSDYKPIPGDPAVMSEGQATWPASSVSLLSGERDAVLIDALITFDEARKAAEWIRTKGKGLTTIYITHGHADHMFGLNTLLAVFPDARAVALAEVMPAIQSRTRGDSARPSPAPVRVAVARDHLHVRGVTAAGMPVPVVILPHYSYLLAGLIPQARVKIYPDSAHGGSCSSIARSLPLIARHSSATPARRR
jgi:hypothetical protein